MAGGRRSDWRARPGGDVQLCEKFQPKPKAWTACPPEVPTKTVVGAGVLPIRMLSTACLTGGVDAPPFPFRILCITLS
jgi:hypothetical protein